jgi:hypothetical protein
LDILSPPQCFFTPTNTLHTGIIVASSLHLAPPDLLLQLDLFFTTCVKFGFVLLTDFPQHRFKTSIIFSISPFLSFMGSHFFQKHIELIQMDQEQESRARRILKRLLVRMNPV